MCGTYILHQRGNNMTPEELRLCRMGVINNLRSQNKTPFYVGFEKESYEELCIANSVQMETYIKDEVVENHIPMDLFLVAEVGQSDITKDFVVEVLKQDLLRLNRVVSNGYEYDSRDADCSDYPDFIWEYGKTKEQHESELNNIIAPYIPDDLIRETMMESAMDEEKENK